MDGRIFHTFLWLLMRAFFETFLFLYSLFLPQYISVYLFWAPLFILGAFSEYLVIPFFCAYFRIRHWNLAGGLRLVDRLALLRIGWSPELVGWGLLIAWLCWGSDDPQSIALLYCGPLHLFRNRSVICREWGAGEESWLWMDSSALSFCSPLPPTGISGSTSLSKVLQEKLAITIKTLEDSWGSVHTDHSLWQTEVCAFLGVDWLPVITQERWGVTELATLWPSSLVASSLTCVLLTWWVECLPCPLGRHHCPKRIAHGSCCAL